MTDATGPSRSRPASWAYALRTTNPPPGPIDQLDRVTRWIVVSRAAVLPMTLVAGLVAALLTIGDPRLDWRWLLLSILGITLAHLANNLMNDLYDTRAGSDTAEYPRALYAPHPILSGLVSKRALLRAAIVVNLADLVILVVLTQARGWPMVAFALAGFLLSVAYTAPPLRLKKRGLGEPDVLIVWGPLMVCGTYYAAVGHVGWHVLLASLPYGLLCVAVLMGKHTDKIPFDAPLGIRTLPVVLGDRSARLATLGLMMAFYPLVGLCVLLGAMPWPALLVLLGVPRLVKVWPHLLRPPPDEPPSGFPVWPLWYAALVWLHTRQAGLLLVLGLCVGAAIS
ncbi:prenyltransferase [Pseudonocardia spinosispora]|uniref:prenyltransferase n=1 Tax=Pseudonocardia spinosispora TaxID=103441 RepID=UPI0004155BC7|nr:prenyltransferase [Pseudonocardia spinosispora]